jgi:hypothetical protein
MVTIGLTMAGVPTVGPELLAALTWGISEQTKQRSAIGDCMTDVISRQSIINGAG